MNPSDDPITSTVLRDFEAVDIFGSLSDLLRLSIVQFVLQNPGCTQITICQGLDKTAGVISHHSKILEEVGVLERQKSGHVLVHSVRIDKLLEVGKFIASIVMKKEGRVI